MDSTDQLDGIAFLSSVGRVVSLFPIMEKPPKCTLAYVLVLSTLIFFHMFKSLCLAILSSPLNQGDDWAIIGRKVHLL